MINLSLSQNKYVSYSFIWMLFVIPSCVFSASEFHKRCSGSFECGNQRNLVYPFWKSGREDCGHPDFKLDCIGEFAELSISSVRYRILEANYASRVIRLARVDYINNLCPLNPPNAPFNQNVLPFAPETETLTIFPNCGQDFSQYVSTNVGNFDCEDDDIRNYYVTRNLSSPPLDGISELLNQFRGSCSRNVSIPASKSALDTLERSPSTDNLKKALEEGFEVEVNSDCRTCTVSGGACGYNQTQTSSGFVCFCEDRTENRTCNSRKKSKSTYLHVLISKYSSRRTTTCPFPKISTPTTRKPFN